MPPAPGPRARPDRATRVLEAFRARFGSAHELFACHAAFPAALTPELAYQLWAAFRADVHGRPLGVPWIAVADLLLSPLCAEIGEELYEMAPDVRAALRRRLLDDPRLGPQRAAEVSELLFEIAADGLHSEDAYERTLAQAQRLTALAHSAPERAAAVLAGMLAGIGAEDHAGWMRMASLMEGLAEPLAGFPALAQLAPAMAARGRGEAGPLAAFVREHGAAVEVGGVRLTVPEPAPERATAEIISPAVDVPPVEAPRRLWVLVAGTGTPQLDDVTAWAAEELGRALADAGHCLVTGGSSGVDDVVAEAFAVRLEHQGEAVNERLTRILYIGEGSFVRRGLIVWVEHTPLAAWRQEAFRRSDAVILAGGGVLVADLALTAKKQGRPVVPLPWTGGSAQRVAAAMGHRPGVSERLVMMEQRARRLLDGEPRFHSDVRFLMDRVMAVLALHDPAAERAYRAYARAMARLMWSLEATVGEWALELRDFMAELLTESGAMGLDMPADPELAIREIEATLPATVHWLVADFLRLRAAEERVAEQVLPLLTPLLARRARHLAPPVIGRMFDDRSAGGDRWLLRWMREPAQVLRPEEYQRWVQEIAARWAESYLTAPSPEEADRIADGMASTLHAAKLAPQVEPLLPLLADPRPAARVAGYLVCRTFALPVPAEALDASLRLEQRAVEERGATAALRQLLGCYEVVPDIEHGPAARLAAAGLARTARLLERKEPADANGSCGRAIRALLETRFRDAAALLDRLDAAARRYESIRRTMPSGGNRTALMDELVQEVIKNLNGVRLTPEELSARFHEGEDGDRMVALAGVLVAEDPASFPLVLQAIEAQRSMMEQYWALRAASGMLRKLKRSSLSALRAALEHQLSGDSESKIMKERHDALRVVAQGILKDIEDLLGRAQQQLLDMVPIPAGRFWMGSEKRFMQPEDQLPRHEVELSAFEIGRVPVTQRQYWEVIGENPSSKQEDEWPVIDVSWFDAVRFCNALSKREGLTPAYRIDGDKVEWDKRADGYRLPTEAEWEYAARGTDERIYPWGNAPPTNQLCWDGMGNDLGFRRRYSPSPVGSYANGVSPFGLLDMAGNVWEWCWDFYAPYEAAKNPEKNPIGPAEGNEHIVRGGSWLVFEPSWVQVSFRGVYVPAKRGSGVGFRCVRGRVQ